jgi:hypothetical protein
VQLALTGLIDRSLSAPAPIFGVSSASAITGFRLIAIPLFGWSSSTADAIINETPSFVRVGVGIEEWS